jgi:hypothetical protein
LLRALLVARLLLSAFVTHDALILAASRSARRLWHAFLATMFAALILHTFQIVFLWHCDHPFRICSSMRFRATGSGDQGGSPQIKGKIRRQSRGGSPPASAKLAGKS